MTVYFKCGTKSTELFIKSDLVDRKCQECSATIPTGQRYLVVQQNAEAYAFCSVCGSSVLDNFRKEFRKLEEDLGTGQEYLTPKEFNQDPITSLL